MSPALIAIPILIILVLVGLFVFWGVSLAWRGLSRAKNIEGRRSCPACDEDMRGLTTLTCPTCSNIASTEADLQTRKPIRPAIIGGIASMSLGLIGLFGSSYLLGWLFESDEFVLRISTLAAFAFVLIAIALMARGLYGDRARGRRRCPSCWYPIRTAHLTCPECGHTVRDEAQFFRTRRSGKLIVAGVCALLFACVPTFFSNFKRGGPVGFAPTPLLIYGMRHMPDEWLSGGSPSADEDLSLHERLLEDPFFPPLHNWYQQQTALQAFDLYMTDPSRPKIYASLVEYASDDNTRREIVKKLVASLQSPSREVALRAADAMSDLEIFAWGNWNDIEARNTLFQDSDSEQIILSLLNHPEPAIQDAALELSYLAGKPRPGVSDHLFRQVQAGRTLSPAGWNAISYHGLQTMPEADFLSLLKEADPWSAMNLLMRLPFERLRQPEVQDILLAHLENSPSRDAWVIGSVYAARSSCPDRVIPLLCARLAGTDLESHRFLLAMTRYTTLAPEAISFIMIALNDPRDRMRVAACESLTHYATTFPEYAPMAESALAARLNDPSTDVRKTANWSYQQITGRH